MSNYRRPDALSNTKWPGASRHAAYLPPLSVLLSIAQLSLGALLFRKLWHFSHTGIVCTDPDADGPTTKYPPLTIAVLVKEEGNNVGFTNQFSVDEPPSDLAVILSCIVLPIFVLMASIYSTTKHFWDRSGRGSTPGGGALNGAILLGGWVLVWVHDRLTRVDYPRIVDWFPICGVEDALAAELAVGRITRVRVALGKYGVICAGMLVVFVYIGMALYARVLNQREAKRNAERVHYLPPDAYSATELRTMQSWHGAQPSGSQSSSNLNWTAPTERRSRGGWGPKPATPEANLTGGAGSANAVSNSTLPRMETESGPGSDGRTARQAQAQAGEHETNRSDARAAESARENDLENPFRDPEVVESSRKGDHRAGNGEK